MYGAIPAGGTHPARFGRRSARGGLCLALALLLYCLVLPHESQAGWLLDQGRFHISAHKDIACADCHEAITEAKTHPEAGQVNMAGPAAFKLDQCLNCHGDVVDEVFKGMHGGKPMLPGMDYAKCASCHDPHTVVNKKGLPPAFDPKRPVQEQCGACHEARPALPALAADDENCMRCHRQQTGSAANGLCLSCHAADRKMAGMTVEAGLLSAEALKEATHQSLTCADCHGNAAQFPHKNQTRRACVSCHSPHGESQAHDVHIGVACESCHLAGVTAVKKTSPDGRGTGIGFALIKDPLLAHTMRLTGDEASCARCHVSGNELGASSSILPAKSVLCIGCHASTFTVGDASSWPFLAIFCASILVMGAFWLMSGVATPAGPSVPHTHSPSLKARLLRLPGVVFFDILLQRRLYRENRERWGIHALIFFPFLFRFLWGLVALLGSLWAPGHELPWLLLDKNNAVGGFLFDASGLALLLGLVLAGRWWLRHPQTAADMPRRDWPALGLLGAITLVGFLLEGMRIAMTGMPAGSSWSFVGALLAQVFAGAGASALQDAYGAVWYTHAILTGITVAYIPFSQLRHIFTAPLLLLVDALKNKH